MHEARQAFPKIQSEICRALAVDKGKEKDYVFD